MPLCRWGLLEKCIAIFDIPLYLNLLWLYFRDSFDYESRNLQIMTLLLLAVFLYISLVLEYQTTLLMNNGHNTPSMNNNWVSLCNLNFTRLSFAIRNTSLHTRWSDVQVKILKFKYTWSWIFIFTTNNQQRISFCIAYQPLYAVLQYL